MSKVTPQDITDFVNDASDPTVLLEIRSTIDFRLDAVRENEIKEYLKQGQKLAARYNMPIDQISEGLQSRHGRGTAVPPKYRHPDNFEQKWTGRGKRPNWVNEWLNENPNNQLEELLVNKPEA